MTFKERETKQEQFRKTSLSVNEIRFIYPIAFFEEQHRKEIIRGWLLENSLSVILAHFKI